MDTFGAVWDGVRDGGRRAVEAPACLAAVGVAALVQLIYESKRPDAFPAAADWALTALLMAAFLAFVLRRLRPSVPWLRGVAYFALAQAASTAVLTVVFLVAHAGFLSVLAPAVPAACAAQAAFALMGRGRSRRAEAAWLGALYALTSFAFSYFLRLLPGGAAALPATAFFAFMGLFAAAAPAALDG
jgi:hypothetical protein